jgi:hypothetical protein
VLWLLEFTRDDHRYRAELRSGSSEAHTESETPPEAFWYVSMDGEPPRLAFDASVRDEDTEEFRARIVAAARGERGVGLRPADISLQDPAYGKEPKTAEKRPRR